MSEFSSPGEQANDGFKMFNMSVAEFATAAAMVSSIAENFERVYGKQQRAAKKQQTDTAKAVNGFTSAADEFKASAKVAANAAKDQKAAAKKLEEALKKQQQEARKNTHQTASWVRTAGDELKKVVSSFKVETLKSAKRLKDFMTKPRGDARGFLKTKAGKMFDFLVGTVTDFAKKMLAYVAPIAIISKLLKEIWSAFKGRLDENRAARRDFGLGFGNNRIGNLRDGAARALNGAPLVATPEQTRAILVQLNAELRNSRRFTGDIVADIMMMQEGLGVDAATSAKFFGRALRTTKATAQDITDTFSRAAITFDNLGINVSETISELASMPEIAQRFNLETKRGQMELVRQASTAKLLGSNLGAAREFGDQFIEIGSAAEAAVNLRQWGLNISARELTTRGLSDPTGLAADIARGLAPTLNRGDADERRFAAANILRSNPQLSAFFGDIEGLLGAASAVGSADFDKKVAEAVAAAGKTPQEKLNDTLKEYTIATTTIGTAVDNAFKTLAQEVARLVSPDFLPALVDSIVRLIGELSYLTYIMGEWNPMKVFSGLSRAEFEAEQIQKEKARRREATRRNRATALGRSENEFRRQFFSDVQGGAFTDASTGDYTVTRSEIADYITKKFEDSGQDVESLDVMRAIQEVTREQMAQLERLMRQNPSEFKVVTATGEVLMTMAADHKGTEGQGSSG